MGAVYEGTHRDLKKRVAIKTLHPSVAATPGRGHGSSARGKPRRGSAIRTSST